QILMQGGHHPKLPFRWYVDLLQHIRAKYPHINIHGFSPPEFHHFAETFRMPLREVISEFKNAGLGSIPGGGGEILVDRVRKKISPLKINSDQWLEVMQVAHELGLRSSATMMLEENVVSSAGTTFRLNAAEIESLIRDAGYEPRRRNNWYELLNLTPSGVVYGRTACTCEKSRLDDCLLLTHLIAACPAPVRRAALRF